MMKTITLASRTAVLAVLSIQLLSESAPRGRSPCHDFGRLCRGVSGTRPHSSKGATKHKIITLATSMGTGTESIPSRLQRGEPVDVVIVADADLDELIKDGRVVAGSRCRAGKIRHWCGCTRQGAFQNPTSARVDALKRTLLASQNPLRTPAVSVADICPPNCFSF